VVQTEVAANVVVVEQAKVFCFEKTIYSSFFDLTSNTPIINRRERGQKGLLDVKIIGVLKQ